MSTAAQSAASHTRAIYRQLLRELPPVRTPSGNSSTSTPLRSSIRKHISQDLTSSSVSPSQALARRQEAEQFVQYLQSQRIYLSLLERYNPGMGMDEEQRVRLTARRVGMEMPEEWYGKK